MESKDKKEKTGVAKLRERFYEIKRNIKISPELEEATRQKKKPVEKRDEESNQNQKKIASPKRDKDIDL